MTKFHLKDSFLEPFKTRKPNFGFNGLGELTYMRTYSRLKQDGTNEQWWETIKRVVEGTYSLQKSHIQKFRLGWSEYKAEKSAEEMYERMFEMKFLPPGRGLWAMGSEITDRGLFAALNNCAFVSTQDIGKSIEESTKPFEFLMDMSMLGVGVGFDVKGADKITIKQPRETGVPFQIPDTREGWVESVALVLRAYFHGHERPIMDYSIIRKEGTLIKTFGGKASGPAPLIKLHEQLDSIFQDRVGDRITVTDITDIQNMIGCCVVAGNVRRTAEIVFGSPNDEEYLSLKDYKWDGNKMVGKSAHRAEYGWTSNNSVYCDIGMDYTRVGDQTAINGEPGYAYLVNAQAYGRMIDPRNWADKKALGMNPCVEQTLESFELCCLVETFPTRATSLEDYKRTLKFAYLYAKTVTLGETHWSETNRVMLRNRRIGTSQSGIAQFVESEGIEAYRQWCDEGYKEIQRYDEIYSDWLCIPRSKKTTSVKPSGTVSLLPGVTPGMHYPEDSFYIRRMRISDQSPLVQRCIDAGFGVEDDVVSANTKVISIPVKIEGVRTVSQVSMWEQVSLAAFIQKWWADNQVSCTVTFKPEEGPQIKHALNYFQYDLKGISFLPKAEVGAYPQMPYEGVTREKYDELFAKVKAVDFTGIGEESVPERYCDGDKCEI